MGIHVCTKQMTDYLKQNQFSISNTEQMRNKELTL